MSPIDQVTLTPPAIESWIGRATEMATGRGAASPAPESADDLLVRYAGMLSRCRTPHELMIAQLWAVRAQCEVGLTQAGRVALAFGESLQAGAGEQEV